MTASLADRPSALVLPDDPSLPLLHALAEMAGIELSYYDIHGEQHHASPEVLRALLKALGLAAEEEEAVRQSVADLRQELFGQPLPPTVVVRQGREEPPTVRLSACAGLESGMYLDWSVRTEEGASFSGRAELVPGTGDEAAASLPVAVLQFALPQTLPVGYHQMTACGQTVRLVVAPAACWLPDGVTLTSGAVSRRLWGIGAQLYSVRSEQNWGIGDFADLAALCEQTAARGGQMVGVNPLHVLFAGRPQDASPYSPNSRLFLNPLYLSIESIPEFALCPEAQSLWASVAFQDRLAAARAAEFVDYPLVASLKIDMLHRLFAAFEAHGLPERREAFAAFVQEGGQRLARFALFQALQEHHNGLPWQQWPEAMQSPEAPAVADFAQHHQAVVRFHLWVQFECDRQLAAAAETLRAGAPSSVGLYRDLAVGANSDGADLWMDGAAYARAARFGAPPDDLGPLGQDWGLPPFHPLELRRMGYAPFIDMLRANMRHAGALRIDHAMSLLHLFWIAPGFTAVEGVYVRYPFEDLLGIVALESHRARCMIIGEDLGTVPDGFRPKMEQEQILSYRILYFERYAESHLFKRPETYPLLALATPTSHDIATIAGHWSEWDIAMRYRLGLMPEGCEQAADSASRQVDRDLLKAALVDQQVLAASVPAQAAVSAEDMQQIIVGFHRFLARSPSLVALINFDDLVGEVSQVNVPGTMSEYPNWRRRLSLTVNEAFAGPIAQKTIAAIVAER